MSKKTKYLKEEDLTKLDTFIQESLNKYFYVDTWDKLYSNTGKHSYDIISYKSTIPDLVIYNKTFNKNDCFFYSNKNNSNNKFTKFPRIQFLLRPKRIKYYNPSDTYEENKEEENLKPKITETFEFKSIPKEIEDKYNNDKNIKKESNVLLDELQDFMKSDKENSNENKVKLIKENENITNEQGNIKKDGKDKPKENKENFGKNRKYSNNGNYHKNKFEAPMNMNNMNPNINYNMNNFAYNSFINYQKMIGFLQYRNLFNNQLYNSNNKQMNKFNQAIPQENKDTNKNNENNKNINDNNNNSENINGDKNSKNKDNSNTIISYYDNQKDDNKVDNQKKELEKLINNMDDFIKKNVNRRGWKVVDIRNNIIVNNFNNEQLFLFLNTILSRNEEKFYSINDLETDVLFNPVKIYEDLKKVYQK